MCAPYLYGAHTHITQISDGRYTFECRYRRGVMSRKQLKQRRARRQQIESDAVTAEMARVFEQISGVEFTGDDDYQERLADAVKRRVSIDNDEPAPSFGVAS